MDIIIKNITLDKDEYIFGIDKEIKISFELFSYIGEEIKELNVVYGCKFRFKDYISNAFQKKIVEENIFLDREIGKKFSYVIPINFFNLNKNNSSSTIKIDNFINIQINNGMFQNKNLKEIQLNIVMNSNLYDIKNLNIESEPLNIYNKKSITNNGIPDMKSGKMNIKTTDFKEKSEPQQQMNKNSTDEMEFFISKKNEKNYQKIVEKINKIIDILKKNNENSLNEDEDFENNIFEELEDLKCQKKSLFIVKEGEVRNYKTLQEEKKIIMNDIEKLESDNLQKHFSYLNAIKAIEYRIYKTYLVSDERTYNSLLELYFSDLNSQKTNALEHMFNKIEESKKIEQDSSEFQIIKKRFQGIITGGTVGYVENHALTGDSVHKEIFKKIKGNIFINIFSKLINSRIYNFMYKYAVFVSIIGVILFFLEIKGIKIINFPGYYLFIWVLGPIIFILLSKVIEILFQKAMNNAIYDFKLVNDNKLKTHLEEKLHTGRLQIYDIFENFKVKVDCPGMHYNFKVVLELNVSCSYSEVGSSNRTHTKKVHIYSLELFNFTGKGEMDIKNVQLLENNYKKISDILVNSNKETGNEISYSIVYIFDSPYLPDLDGENKLYLEFNKK